MTGEPDSNPRVHLKAEDFAGYCDSEAGGVGRTLLKMARLEIASPKDDVTFNPKLESFVGHYVRY